MNSISDESIVRPTSRNANSSQFSFSFSLTFTFCTSNREWGEIEWNAVRAARMVVREDGCKYRLRAKAYLPFMFSPKINKHRIQCQSISIQNELNKQMSSSYLESCIEYKVIETSKHLHMNSCIHLVNISQKKRRRKATQPTQTKSKQQSMFNMRLLMHWYREIHDGCSNKWSVFQYS